MNSNSIVYVFVRNKLISSDSFLPVALELNNRFKVKVHFITLHEKTFHEIRKNTIIHGAIKDVGSLIYPRNKLEKALLLLKLVFSCFFKKTYIFHFGTIVTGPLSILLSLNKKRTFYTEPDAQGFSPFAFAVDYCRRPMKYSIDGKPAPKYGAFLAFGHEWLWLHDKRVSHLPKFKIIHPRNRKVWLKYIENLNKDGLQIEENKKVVTLILGFFGMSNITRTENSIREKFLETLDCLKELGDESLVIFLKPHPATDLKILSAMITKYPTLDIRVTYLHPSLLAQKSMVFICNQYSSAMYDGFLFGVPTLEHADYCDEALAVSGNQSVRPEFITSFASKKEELSLALQQYLLRPKGEKVLQRPETDDSFFEYLEQN